METPTPQPMPPLLHMQNISKSFPGVHALQNVDLEVYPGEILALVGENGAGKSTLMKILNGVYTADSGQILWQGHPVAPRSPQAARALGISIIHQELALIPYLDAGKNIYLGREPRGLIPGTINYRKLYKLAQADLQHIHMDINMRVPVRFLSIAQQQMVEVARALSTDARLIVMDEPTSSLTDREVDTLFAQMRALREKGVSVIFISHRLAEVFTIADRVAVLRDGTFVGSQPVSELQPEDIIRMMVGREVGQVYEKGEPTRLEDVVLEVQHLSRGRAVQDVSFKLHKGEILGVAGLVGAGRTELAEAIFGATPARRGKILLEGRPVRIRRPGQAIRQGIGFVSEDRKKLGLFLRMSVAMNIVMASLWRMLLGPIINWAKVRQTSDGFIQRMGIRTPSRQQKVKNLSGGNQQKVVIARWLTRNPRVLILDEPTRGIDVGAKAEIYKLMHELAGRGVGILMISSELPEVLGVSDRVLVMAQGRLAGEFDPAVATQDDLMRAATNTPRRNEQSVVS